MGISYYDPARIDLTQTIPENTRRQHIYERHRQ